MTTLFFFLTFGLIVFRAFKRRQTQPAPPARPVTRSHAQGDAGEALVHDELRRVLTWLCGENFYLHPAALLLNHAPGRPFPTAEVDHLAITPFGIFVIETKNWTGCIEPTADMDFLVRTGADGQRELRRSPLAQNRSKIAFLRGILPPVWEVEGVGVFAHDACALSRVLPVKLIRRHDLNQWLRDRKVRHEARGARAIDIQNAWKAIQSVCAIDANGIAMARHRQQVSLQGPFPRGKLTKVNSIYADV